MIKPLLLALVLATSGCASTRVLSDFTTDGCSLFPDGDGESPQRWSECCLRHDLAYWRGGTAQERAIADTALHDCVLARTGSSSLARTMYLGARLGGAPLLPTWFRWGYGWGYGRGNAPLTADEQKELDARSPAAAAP